MLIKYFTMNPAMFDSGVFTIINELLVSALQYAVIY